VQHADDIIAKEPNNISAKYCTMKASMHKTTNQRSKWLHPSIFTRAVVRAQYQNVATSEARNTAHLSPWEIRPAWKIDKVNTRYVDLARELPVPEIEPQVKS
jgi:hypothetical protein